MLGLSEKKCGIILNSNLYRVPGFAVFCYRAKLYRYESATKEWKGQGVGRNANLASSSQEKLLVTALYRTGNYV
jgi:hypothetical protein